MIKKVFFAVVIIVLLLSGEAYGYEDSANASAAEAAVYLDGSNIGANAYIQNDSVYLPVKAVCQALGYTVQWSNINNEQVVTATKNGESITLNLTDQTITNDGHSYYIADGCILNNNHTYLSSQYFAENFCLSFQYDATDNTVTVNSIVENPISITTMKLYSADENLIVDVQYPQINGLADINIQSSINAVFSHAAAAAIEEGLQYAYDNSLVKQQYPDYTNVCDTDINYRITYNQNGLLGVVLYIYQYAGGAHGGTVQTSYLIDLDTGNILKLSDLMKSGSSYGTYINSAIRTEIDKRVASGNLSEFEDGKFKNIGDNPEFYLTDDSIVFYFQEYQYFPYAAGIQEFPIKYAELASILNNNYSFPAAQPMQLEKGVQNNLNIGDSAFVKLSGNPTTGYSWHCVISDESILKLTSENYVSDSNLIGAGGQYTWGFKAQKAGQTTVTFKYYRDWEGEKSATAENTVVYQITVK